MMRSYAYRFKQMRIHQGKSPNSPPLTACRNAKHRIISQYVERNSKSTLPRNSRQYLTNAICHLNETRFGAYTAGSLSTPPPLAPPLVVLYVSCSPSNLKPSTISFEPLPADYPKENLSPCVPSPCGANANCREQNGAGSCTCIEDHFGNPYEGCRPECVLNSDCPTNRACVRNKCQDPCPGTCGQNAECQVVNHLPSCTCIEGYEGDPFRYCVLKQRERKNPFFLNAFLIKTTTFETDQRPKTLDLPQIQTDDKSKYNTALCLVILMNSQKCRRFSTPRNCLHGLTFRSPNILCK